MKREIYNQIVKSVKKNGKKIEEFVANSFANGKNADVEYKQEVDATITIYPEFAEYIKEHYTKKYNTVCTAIALKQHGRIIHCITDKVIRFESMRG